MSIKLTAFCLISPNLPIYTLVADPDVLMAFEKARDLFWAKVQLEQLLDAPDEFRSHLEKFCRRLTSVKRLQVSFFGVNVSAICVASNLPANR
jgi:hypothetical protein